MSEVMAIELAPLDVRVNCISPGVIETAATAPYLDESDPELRGIFLSMGLMTRFGRPEDIAEAAVFLCSDDASYITGVNLPIDGGQVVSGGKGPPDRSVYDMVSTKIHPTLAAQQQTPG
jgi:NAD(P)-dependent dehydrogenase (short-subunit alcohol dehydrogenase family)